MLRWIISGLINQKPMFNVRLVHVGFLVGRVALGQVFVKVFWFSPVSIIPSMLHTHVWFIYHWCHIILSIHSLTFKWPAFMYTNTCKNTARNLLYIFRQQKICYIFKTWWIIFYFPKYAVYSITFIFSCSNNTHVLHNHVLKCKYHPSCLKVSLCHFSIFQDKHQDSTSN